MNESFLTNTSTEGLQPLGTAPQRSYELVSDTVREACGEAAAALFAEPVPTQYGDRFDWYATVDGQAVPLAALEDPEPVREVLAGLVAKIKDLADELMASKLAEKQRLGEALANALEIPDEDAIFVIQGADGGAPQPVLVNWAWTKDAQVAVRGVLTGMDTRAPAQRPGYVPPPAAAAAMPLAAGAGTAAVAGVSAIWWWLVWLGWLLLALLIASVIYLMIEPCALRISWLPNTCERVEEIPDTLYEERLLLEDQITQVQKEIHIKDRLCQPDFALLPIPDPDAVVPPETGVQPSLPIDPEVDDRADRAGAERGDLSFTLIWEGSDDLDLHTTCPAGDTLFFLDKVQCNGEMDLDMNGFQVVPDPVENTYFTDPLPGDYRVRVHLYRQRDGNAPRSFTLQIREGDRVTTQKGTVSVGAENWQYTYRYGGK
ncbi:hypothetical protein [Roseobacter sp. OBYS 0001]|uniref:hypothetical protein n=1 Tax=Roseobacter sp. OBYS 0001 TaxID=882651 RepID=UPI001BC2F227|nr:hypothetical protein [Roseobacter sp. OBYS 0001]GIT87556.1 hypothetical protein ROBYS_25720 [Roseobacter sp. OBYS 0001]